MQLSETDFIQSNYSDQLRWLAYELTRQLEQSSHSVPKDIP